MLNSKMAGLQLCEQMTNESGRTARFVKRTYRQLVKEWDFSTQHSDTHLVAQKNSLPPKLNSVPSNLSSLGN